MSTLTDCDRLLPICQFYTHSIIFSAYGNKQDSRPCVSPWAKARGTEATRQYLTQSEANPPGAWRPIRHESGLGNPPPPRALFPRSLKPSRRSKKIFTEHKFSGIIKTWSGDHALIITLKSMILLINLRACIRNLMSSVSTP